MFENDPRNQGWKNLGKTVVFNHDIGVDLRGERQRMMRDAERQRMMRDAERRRIEAARNQQAPANMITPAVQFASQFQPGMQGQFQIGPIRSGSAGSRYLGGIDMLTWLYNNGAFNPNTNNNYQVGDVIYGTVDGAGNIQFQAIDQYNNPFQTGWSTDYFTPVGYNNAGGVGAEVAADIATGGLSEIGYIIGRKKKKKKQAQAVAADQAMFPAGSTGQFQIESLRQGDGLGNRSVSNMDMLTWLTNQGATDQYGYPFRLGGIVFGTVDGSGNIQFQAYDQYGNPFQTGWSTDYFSQAGQFNNAGGRRRKKKCGKRCQKQLANQQNQGGDGNNQGYLNSNQNSNQGGGDGGGQQNQNSNQNQGGGGNQNSNQGGGNQNSNQGGGDGGGQQNQNSNQGGGDDGGDDGGDGGGDGNQNDAGKEYLNDQGISAFEKGKFNNAHGGHHHHKKKQQQQNQNQNQGGGDDGGGGDGGGDGSGDGGQNNNDAGNMDQHSGAFKKGKFKNISGPLDRYSLARIQTPGRVDPIYAHPITPVAVAQPNVQQQLEQIERQDGQNYEGDGQNYEGDGQNYGGDGQNYGGIQFQMGAIRPGSAGNRYISGADMYTWLASKGVTDQNGYPYQAGSVIYGTPDGKGNIQWEALDANGNQFQTGWSTDYFTSMDGRRYFRDGGDDDDHKGAFEKRKHSKQFDVSDPGEENAAMLKRIKQSPLSILKEIGLISKKEKPEPTKPVSPLQKNLSQLLTDVDGMMKAHKAKHPHLHNDNGGAIAGEVAADAATGGLSELFFGIERLIKKHKKKHQHQENDGGAIAGEVAADAATGGLSELFFGIERLIKKHKKKHQHQENDGGAIAGEVAADAATGGLSELFFGIERLIKKHKKKHHKAPVEQSNDGGSIQHHSAWGR
jgi:hypothetical protein